MTTLTTFFMTKEITFLSILNPVEFLRVQNEFMSQNIYLNNPKNYFKECQKTDFGIVAFKDFSFKESSTEPDFFFFKDYLKLEIQTLETDFIQSYKKEYKRLELSNGNIKLYYTQTIDKLLRYEELLIFFNHLNDDLKKVMKEKIEFCIDKIQDLKKGKDSFLGEKMHFKMKRQDVLVLFYLLRENGLIKWHTNSELKILLENNFKLYDSNTEEFKDIKVGRNVFSDFTNGSRPINSSIEELKRLLQRDDFFNVN